MDKLTMNLFGISKDKEEIISSFEISQSQTSVNLSLKGPGVYSKYECRWEQRGSSVVDSFIVEPEDTKIKISGNAVTDHYVWLFDMEKACLVFIPKEKKEMIHITFNIRFYNFKNDSEFITAIGNCVESMSPLREKYKERFEQMAEQYEDIQNSTFWKMTVIPQKIIDRIREKNYAMPVAWKHKKSSNYAEQITNIDAARRKEEEDYLFPKKICFSILVPLYNTPKIFLKELVESVKGQTYKDWELCLADASDNKQAYIQDMVKSYSSADSRIKYMKLKENRGISYNTNECATMATGEYICLLDHDDLLHPSALFKTMKAICDDNADFIYTDEVTFNNDDLTDLITLHYKSDYAKDTLLSNNYICHFSSFKKELFDEVGGFRDEYNGSQDHDLILRLTDRAKNVVHIPEILYFWRSHNNSTSRNIDSKKYAIQAGRNAVHDFLASKGIKSSVSSSPAAKTIYHIHYAIMGEPKVSIIIPNKNHYDLIKNCVDSIVCRTNYQNYEIIIVDNQSTEFSTLNYYDQLIKNNRFKLVKYEHPFNFSAMNNYASKFAEGEYILFLNNDIEVISPEWMSELLMYAQRDDVGAVGAKLIYPDETIQHAGIILGAGEDHVAAHAHLNWPRNTVGYMGKLDYVSDYMAVTGACLMTKKSLFDKVNGFDEEHFAVAYNDIDLCLKFYEDGKINVFNPFAELYHYESASRGLDSKDNKKRKRLSKEVIEFHRKWDFLIKKGDPYYNPNLSDDGLYRIRCIEDENK